MWTKEESEKLVSHLKSIAIEKNKSFNEKLAIPDNNYGVRIPDLDKIAREIVKAGRGLDYLQGYEKTNYEGDVIYGMIIGYEKLEKRKPYIRKFALMCDNWSTVDTCVARWKFMKKGPVPFLDLVDEFLAYHDEYHSRIAYVLLLDYYLTDNLYKEVYYRLRLPVDPYYYSEMAAAWLISMGLAKYPEVFEKLLNEVQFSDFVYRKALTKAIESFQVSDEKKALYREMRKARKKEEK